MPQLQSRTMNGSNRSTQAESSYNSSHCGTRRRLFYEGIGNDMDSASDNMTGGSRGANMGRDNVDFSHEVDVITFINRYPSPMAT